MKLALLGIAALGTCSGALAQTSPPPPACAAAEHRQFDYWIGHWDVYPSGKDQLVAHSLVEKLYAGCTIRENWMPLKGAGGGSLNMYDSGDKRWHQTWHDSSNSRIEFDGGLAGKEMVLTGFWPGVNGPGKDGLIRMVYTPNADGSVRQHGSVSTDQGMTWSPSFDFIYRKSKDPAPK
jgi:hypothetical protein